MKRLLPSSQYPRRCGRFTRKPPKNAWQRITLWMGVLGFCSLHFASQPALAQSDDDLSFDDADLGGDDDTADANEHTSADEEEASATPEVSPEKEATAPKAAESSEKDVGAAQSDRIKAVSRKLFLKRHRFAATPLVGFTTNDAYFRHYGVGMRVAYHLVEDLSIEMSGTYNAYTQTLDAVQYLRTAAKAIPGSSTLFGYGDVGFTFTPLYGKFAVLGDAILHFDAYVSGGFGTVIESRPSIPFYPAATVGIGGQVFVFDWMVIRADLRDYAYSQQLRGISTLQNLLVASLGVGFFFPFGFSYQNQAYRIVDVK